MIETRMQDTSIEHVESIDLETRIALDYNGLESTTWDHRDHIWYASHTWDQGTYRDHRDETWDASRSVPFLPSERSHRI